MKTLMKTLSVLTLATVAGNLSNLLDTNSTSSNFQKSNKNFQIISDEHKNSINEVDSISFHKYIYNKPVSFIWYYQIMFKDETMFKIGEVYKSKDKKETIEFIKSIILNLNGYIMDSEKDPQQLSTLIYVFFNDILKVEKLQKGVDVIIPFFHFYIPELISKDYFFYYETLPQGVALQENK